MRYTQRMRASIALIRAMGGGYTSPVRS